MEWRLSSNVEPTLKQSKKVNQVHERLVSILPADLIAKDPIYEFNLHSGITNFYLFEHF
jgi:hypothetical protein